MSRWHQEHRLRPSVDEERPDPTNEVELAVGES